MPPPFSMWGVGGWVGAGHIVYVHMSRPVLSVPSVRNKNGFRLISFEKISVLDSNFIHRYIIIKYRPSLI